MGIPLIEFAQTVLVFIAALFPIVNPLGGATIFLTMTSGYPPEARHALARKVAVYGFFILLISMFLGSHVLAFFGVSLPAVQVGGGLLVAASAWGMLHKEEDARSRDASRQDPHQDWERHAFYPLTLPLTVGPGSISVALTLGANMTHGLRVQDGDRVPAVWAAVAAMTGITAVCGSVWAAYRSSERISKALGPTGLSIVVRLSSFILLCIGVQIFWNGAARLIAPLLKGVK
ncbi:MAG: multiple antibiotic resistance (MarC)-like protein [Candidatus Solibacter sp.]|nr:multiple antibiotic resistance (MarC)-like protein [Candidatus Solibacter sp.]